MPDLQQLAGTDAAFLALENASTPMQVVGILVLDPTDTDGDYSFERLRQTIADRVHLMPPMMRTLIHVPLGLDRPYWLPVDDIDVDDHIRRVTAEPPGDMHALSDIVGDAATELLPRGRPLWELVVVEGLADGRVAVIARIHHATLYGATGVEFIAQLLDFDPAGRDVAPKEPSAPVEVPGTVGLLGHAALHGAKLPLTAGRMMVNGARSFGGSASRLGRRLVSGSGVGVSRPRRTPLNGSLTPQRSAAFTRVPLAHLRDIKEARGGTVNDVVLAATTQSLREWFLDHGGLPANPPTASCPMSAGGSSVEGTDRLSAMLVSLPIDLDDPFEQLAAVSEATADAKDFTDALGMDAIAGLADATPPPLLHAGANLYGALRLSRLHPPMCSLVVSNLVGPPIQLYLAGAKIEAIYPLGPLLPEVGLNVTVLSDMGTLDVGLLACPDLVPDVWAVADGFAAAVERLHTAATA
jgi:WS/DGAT/MGAT family acyltransferase